MALPLLVSSVLPARFWHGFSTRAGGISTGGFASLNLGFKWGDDPARVRENRSRVNEAAGVPLHLPRQVHGAAVAVVEGAQEVAATAAIEADAVVAAGPGIGVAIMVADCVPVLLADARTGICAAVHAGWRGTAQEIVRATLGVMQARFGVSPGDVCAALGPSIGPCCFEVGDEVWQALAALPSCAGAPLHAPGPRGRPHVNLWEANRRQLVASGVPESQVDVLGACTMCDRARFFSYRRDGAATGQHVGFIVAG